MRGASRVWAVGVLAAVMLGTASLGAPPRRPLRQDAPLSVTDQRLRHWVPKTALLQISGTGTLWQETTGLDPGLSLHVRDKAIMYSLLRRCRIAAQGIPVSFDYEQKKLYATGEIELIFMTSPVDLKIEEIQYVRPSRSGYAMSFNQFGQNEMMPVSPEDGRLFESLIRHLAKCGYAHDGMVKIAPVIDWGN